MRAGKLRHLGIILTPVAEGTTNEYGDWPGQYVQGEQVYFAIEPLSAQERYWASQIRPDLIHKITIRHNANINSSCAIKWYDGTRDRIFQLGPAISTEERYIDMVFTAAESERVPPDTM